MGSNRPIIGIAGGMGPHAGVDLARKVLDETLADRDQDHLPLALVSCPGLVEDRTAFLVGNSATNPAIGILEVVTHLESLGCTVVGIPCNTAHAPPILDVVLHDLAQRGSTLTVLHMMREAVAFVREAWPGVSRVGALTTTGTYLAGLYPDAFHAAGLESVSLELDEQENLLHPAIYDRYAGIKARPSPVTRWARERIIESVALLQGRGAQAVVLGCTELPLAVPELRIGSTILVDATRALARALVRAADPTRLRDLRT